jgi:hypothetical protein
MDRQVEASELELVTYFTCALGVKAQAYGASGGGAYDSNDVHLRMREDRHRGELEKYRLIELTMSHVRPESRGLLSLVYSPHSWPLFLTKAFARPHGSVVGLALRAPAAQAAVRASQAREKKLEEGTGPAAVLAWLSFEAARTIAPPKRLIATILAECEAPHRQALTEYVDRRKERVQAHREIAKLAKADREALLERELRGLHVRLWGGT